METTEELIKANHKDPVPVPERNHFQGFLMGEMGVKRHSGDKEVEWAVAYGKQISDIIDNPEQKEIRDLIDKGYQAYEESMKSDAEEERQILTEVWTDAYKKASEKIRSTLH